MSKTTLAWLLGYFGGAVLSFRDPIFGLLMYLWDYYNHPALRWWGDELPDLRWSLFSAVVVLVSYVVSGRQLFASAIFRQSPVRWLLALLVITFIVTFGFAISSAQSFHYASDLAKLVVLYILIVGIIRSPREFRWFVFAMIIGGMHWGVSAYLDPKRREGRLLEIGGPDSLNDNSTAAHLLPLLPLMAVYLWKGARWQRLVCLAAAPFVINTIILCNSRGATVGIALGVLAALVLATWRLRLQLLVVLAIGGAASTALMDATFIERQMTMFSYEDDGASTDRLAFWSAGLEMLSDRPQGAGGGGFDIQTPAYLGGIVEVGEERAAHNTYLWVAVDWGVLGLICFLGFIVSTVRSLHRIRREATDEMLKLESFALEVGFIAFLGAAFFVNRPYAEMLYWLPALAAGLANIHDRAWVKQEAPAVAVTEGISSEWQRAFQAR